MQQLSGYHAYHLVRNTRAQGGVTIFVSNDFHSEQDKELTTIYENIEINTIRVTINNLTYTLCVYI